MKKAFILPIAIEYWGHYDDTADHERDVENARATLSQMGLSCIEVLYRDTDCHQELWANFSDASAFEKTPHYYTITDGDDNEVEELDLDIWEDLAGYPRY